MYYIIYKTINLINGKYYIGKHQTNNLNDGYVGSGKYLKRAIKKYGIENFETIILHVYDEEWKMNIAEKILVVIDSEVSYNLCPGGKGGFGYISNHIDQRKWAKKGREKTNKIILEKYGTLNISSLSSVKEKIKQSRIELGEKRRKEFIENFDLSLFNDVDFSTKGWSIRLRHICKIRNSSTWLKRYFPEIWEKAWRENNK